MKYTLTTLLLAIGLSISASADEKKAATPKAPEKKEAAAPGAGEKKEAAKEEHDHDHGKIKAGPTGGRLITEVEPHAEFFVNKEKKVEIRFVDDANKIVAPAAQVVTVTLGERSKPTKLTFTKDGDKLVSDKTVPEGNDYPTVVQIKVTPKDKAVTEKFNLNMTKCPTCANAEYACTCEHGADEHEGHDHVKEAPAKKEK